MVNLSPLRSLLCVALIGASWAGAPALAAAERGASPAPLAVVMAEAPALEGKLNPNDASVAQWELLPGVGPTTAARAVEYAKKYPFKDLLHVMRVKGIGRKTYDRIAPYLTLQGTTTITATGGTTAKAEQP